MANTSITFDIETVPKQTPYTDHEQVFFERKFGQELNYQKIDTKTASQEQLDDIARMVKATNPYLGEIVCIGMYDSGSDKQYALSGSEKEILEEFWRILEPHNWFISFNGLNFDIPWILIRSAKYDLNPPRPGNESHPFLNRKRFQLKPHFDLYQWMCDWSARMAVTLEVAAEHLGFDSPKSGTVEAASVEKAFKDGRIEEIKKYCLRDIMTTFKASQKYVKFVYQPYYIT